MSGQILNFFSSRSCSWETVLLLFVIIGIRHVAVGLLCGDLSEAMSSDKEVPPDGSSFPEGNAGTNLARPKSYVWFMGGAEVDPQTIHSCLNDPRK